MPDYSDRSDKEVDEHIAGNSGATQIAALAERQKRQEQKAAEERERMHQESLAAGNRHHKDAMELDQRLHAQTQRIARWGVVVGAAAFIVSLLAFSRDWFPEAFRPAATMSATALSTSGPVSASVTSSSDPQTSFSSTNSPLPSAPLSPDK